MPKRKKDKDGNEILTIREQRFVEGLARGKSKTQAAKDAGYSAKSAADIGKKNPRKPPIDRAVQERLAAVKADTNEVLSLFALHLRSDFGDFDDACWNEDGTINWKVAKKRGLSRLVRRVKRETRYARNEQGKPEKIVKVEVELYDAQAAGRTLAEIAGLKQQPRENEADKRERKKYYEALVTRIIERSVAEGLDIDRETAIKKIVERDAEAVQYFM